MKRVVISNINVVMNCHTYDGNDIYTFNFILICMGGEVQCPPTVNFLSFAISDVTRIALSLL